MKTTTQIILCLVLSLLTGSSKSIASTQLPEVLKTQPYIENKDFSSVIPIDTSGNKIFLNAEVNGKPYRFIFDTGSPTILSRKVVDELGLVIRGENTGKDANGNLVKMDLSVLDRLKIGDVVFRDIPVFVFDYSHLAVGNCIIDGGVIGSEILPLTIWQINFARKELVITNDTRKLEHIDNAQSSKLKVTDYPFTPVLEHAINGQFTDHAIFDTGCTELLHLNHLAFEDLKKRQIVDSVTAKAFGTFGESAGGRGKDATFHLVPLQQLAVGEVRFANIEVWTRNEVPSLIGARIFESHIVTLDYANKIVYFQKYQEPKTETASFGFRPYLKNQSLYVGFLRDPSPATEVGIRLHDQILTINDRDLRHLEASEQYEVLKWFSTVEGMRKIEVTLESNGVTKKVVLRKK